MTIVTEVAAAFQQILQQVSLQAGRDSTFIRRFSRHSRLDGATFVQTLVFGWWAKPQSSLQELAQVAATFGVRITPQGLQQRFTREAVACLHQVLEATAGTVLRSVAVPLPLLERFNGVFVQDSSVIALPTALLARWRGCGGGPRGGVTAALKLQVCWDVLRGQLLGPLLTAAKTHDRDTALRPQELPVGSLWLADLGFFSLALLQQLQQAGVYYVSRVQAGTLVRTSAQGAALTLVELTQQLQLVTTRTPRTPAVAAGHRATWDIPIWLGKTARVPARLLILPVPADVAAHRRAQLVYRAQRKAQPVSQERLALCDWTILVTNVEAARLQVAEALVLYRTRWQIERLFRLWKEVGQIDEWRSSQAERIECEIVAKLLAMVLQHWVLLSSCWEYADRSLHHAARLISKHALHLASALGQRQHLCRALRVIRASLAVGGRVQKRRRKPANFQLLLAPPATGYT